MVSARAATPCRVHRVPAAAFLRLMAVEEHPLLWSLVRSRTRELVNMIRMRTLIDSVPARQRLESVLRRLAEEQREGQGQAWISGAGYLPTNDEFACYAGISLSYVSMIFRDLEREGIIRRSRDGILINRLDLLWKPSICAASDGERSRQADRFKALGKTRRFAAGTQVLQEGETADDVYLVQSGFVRLTATLCGGKELTTGLDERLEHAVGWIAPGGFIGERAALLQEQQPLSAFTRTPCTVTECSAQQYEELLGGENTEVLALLRMKTRELLAAEQDLLVAQSQPMRRRMAYVLSRLGCHQAGGALRENMQLKAYSPTNATLAGLVGTEERYVTSLMNDFRNERLVWRGAGRAIVINDVQELFRLQPYQMPGGAVQVPPPHATRALA
jgi:CRP-like cAMP-binding protein